MPVYHVDGPSESVKYVVAGRTIRVTALVTPRQEPHDVHPLLARRPPHRVEAGLRVSEPSDRILLHYEEDVSESPLVKTSLPRGFP